MMRKTTSIKKRRGAILLLMLLAMVVLAITGMAILRLGLNLRLAAVRRVNTAEARFAADAGVMWALYQMNNALADGSFSSSDLPSATDQPLPNSSATFSFSVTKDQGLYVIESIGQSNLREKTVTATLSLRGPFEYAVFGDESVELKNSAAVSAINAPENFELIVCTNAITKDSVTLQKDCYIDGSVAVGPEADLETAVKDNGADISGQIYAASEDIPVYTINLPLNLQLAPSRGKVKSTTTISSSGKYEEIDLGKKEVITVVGDIEIYVEGKIDLGNDTSIDIADNSSLAIYAGDQIIMKNGSNFNNAAADATKLRIWGLSGCDKIEMKNSSDLYAAIYAPAADIIFKNSADMYGSVLGRTFRQDNSADTYYDYNLRDCDEDDELVRFAICSWREH